MTTVVQSNSSRARFAISRFGSIAVAATLLFGCANWQPVSDSWRGRPIDEVIYAWGPPYAEARLQDGRKTISYRHVNMEFQCIVTFRTDSSSIVTSSTVEGNIGGCNQFFRSKPTAGK